MEVKITNKTIKLLHKQLLQLKQSLSWPNNCTADAPQVEIYELLHISHTSFNLTNVQCPEAEFFSCPHVLLTKKRLSAVYSCKHTACHFLVAILENVSQRHFVQHRHD